MELTFLSVSENESFARSTVAAFITQLDPTLDEINEIKTVVSEAVTNAIIHGYEGRKDQYITIKCKIEENNEIEVSIQDQGVGMDNIAKAIEPLYTSKPHLERSGMGFTIMESFMDAIQIDSSLEKGTTITVKKQLAASAVCH